MENHYLTISEEMEEALLDLGVEISATDLARREYEPKWLTGRRVLVRFTGSEDAVFALAKAIDAALYSGAPTMAHNVVNADR